MRMQVKLEIGHKAACRQSPTTEGYTHDWTVFVRGSEGKDISHFVDKVVFHLHESFPKPKRVVKEPPYKLDECGYGGFELRIEVCFKTKDEPRRVMFAYDLFLPNLGLPPVHNVRTEALTFTHPTEDFMKKLTRGGGVQMSSTNGVSANGLNNGLGNASRDESKDAFQKSSSVSENDKGKKMKLPKTGSKPVANAGVKRSPPHEHTTAGDGTVTKKKKKLSDGAGSSSKGKVPALDPPSTVPLTTEVKDLKVKFKSMPPKEGEKRKQHSSETRHRGKVLPQISKGKDLKSHQEHASSTETKRNSSDGGEHKTKVKKKSEKDGKKSSSEKKEKKDKKDSKEKKEKAEKKTVEKVTIRRSSGDSWASSGSSCGLMANVVGKNKALGKLLSEMSDEDEFEAGCLPTPFKREPSPALAKATPKEHTVGASQKTDHVNTSKHKAKENKPRLSSSFGDTRNTSHRSSNGVTSGPETDETKSATVVKKSPPASKVEEKNGLTRLSKKELYDLYDYITNCHDSDNLQKVVDVIETTGLYTVAEKTFEFDLCLLGQSTLRKIQKCLGLR